MCFVLLVAATAFAQDSQHPLTNDDVIQMVKAKLPESLIQGQMRSSKTNFDLSTTEIIRLSKEGVSEAIIGMMRNPASAQPEPQRVVEPEYNNTAFFLDPDKGNLVPLERQQVNTQVKIRALGFGGGQALAIIKDERSPVRFKSGRFLQFVFRADGRGDDPNALVNIDTLTSSKGNRQIVVVNARAFSGAKSTKGETAVPFEIQKYGTQSYKFSPTQKLPPGEYAITIRTFQSAAAGQVAYLFGID
jgi:hypothetical protein